MPAERRAVLLLLGLAVGGQALRMWLVHPGAAPGETALLPGIPGTPSTATAHRDSGVALARPLGPGETIDLDVAPALEIARLPRVGPRLAKVIAADRGTHGPFGSLAGLDRVPGVGPGLLKGLEGHVRFSKQVAQAGPSDPPEGPPLADQKLRPRQSDLPMDLNSATARDLETLPFIGPSLALRIVAFREKHGRFPAVDSLVRVPGIGPSVLAKVRDRVVAN